MPVQRKRFRIEQTLDDPSHSDDAAASHMHFELVAELRALRDAMQARPAAVAEARVNIPSQDMRRLKIELDVIGDAIKQTKSEILLLQDHGFDSARVGRVIKEIEAVFGDTSGATDRILKAAEQIDESAKALIALARNGHEHGLAEDIQDHVTAIFEACNFHDVTGQRLSKVAATMRLVEDHLARMMEIWSVIERFNVEAAQTTARGLEDLLNGPKLVGDNGHSTQDEIDRLFSEQTGR